MFEKHSSEELQRASTKYGLYAVIVATAGIAIPLFGPEIKIWIAEFWDHIELGRTSLFLILGAFFIGLFAARFLTARIRPKIDSTIKVSHTETNVPEIEKLICPQNLNDEQYSYKTIRQFPIDFQRLMQKRDLASLLESDHTTEIIDSEYSKAIVAAGLLEGQDFYYGKFGSGTKEMIVRSSKLGAFRFSTFVVISDGERILVRTRDLDPKNNAVLNTCRYDAIGSVAITLGKISNTLRLHHSIEDLDFTIDPIFGIALETIEVEHLPNNTKWLEHAVMQGMILRTSKNSLQPFYIAPASRAGANPSIKGFECIALKELSGTTDSSKMIRADMTAKCRLAVDHELSRIK